MEKPILILKPIDIQDTDTARIYNLTQESVQRLNFFVEDFFSTHSILNEEKEQIQSGHNMKSLSETEESISQVQDRINEITEAMNTIAQDMPGLVELKFQSPL